MSRAANPAVLVLTALLIPACGGGGSPAGPAATVTPGPPTPPPPPGPPVARDGETHDVVAAEITPPAPANGARVTARADGYLFREQLFNGTALFLWPGDQNYVNELVYHVQFTDDSYRVIRWGGGITVTVDDAMAANESAMRKTREVVDEMVRRTGLPIAIGPNGNVRVTIDGSILDEFDAIGLASWTFRGATIVGAEVKFARMQEVAGGVNADYANTYLHEMGHVLGLGHSPSTRDVMTPGTGPGSRVGEFQPNEATALHMMYSHRAAGNMAPDRDPALSQSVLVARTRMIKD